MPTYEDIAKIAGVSKATVSLALSDSAKISSNTKFKIRNIAKSIGYNIDKIESAKQIRNRSIGILYFSENPDFEKDFFRDTLLGISEDASNNGYDVVFIGIHWRIGEDFNDDVADKVMRTGVEGIIVLSRTANLNGFGRLMEMRFPMVFVGDRKVVGFDNQLYNVCSDNYNGGRMAAEYLLGLGHPDLALVSLHTPPHWELDRANGFFSQAKNAGLTDIETRSVQISDPFDPNDPSWAKLAELNPSAIFAINARAGISIIHHLRLAGKRIPDDVSLLVFDDFSAFPYENPPITVIKQDKEALGNLSAKVLIDLLENSKVPPKQMLISTQLIERQSCAPYKGTRTK
ncbi:LacI family DNA-binding transcriptional regulator [Paenibacillus sp. HJGM_3]|uniref:LacI family DNA-binding transcriptional regulator n=1 Tax=Paenibacillus sp. HJGM_3 TaxID=3379816 RepID=UPI00385C4D1C